MLFTCPAPCCTVEHISLISVRHTLFSFGSKSTFSRCWNSWARTCWRHSFGMVCRWLFNVSFRITSLQTEREIALTMMCHENSLSQLVRGLCIPQTGDHVILGVAGRAKADYVRPTGFFEFVSEMVILQRDDLEVLECCTAFGVLSHLWIIFVRNQAFHHVAVVAAHLVAVALHGTATICHYNGIQFDVAGLVFCKFSDRFLRRTLRNEEKEK